MASPLVVCKEIARQLRVDSIRCTTAAGSGHPTSALSAADLMAVLLARYLRFDWSNPRHMGNDRLLFSKGHACPLLYAMFKALGVINDQELLSLRKLGSRLEGHPNPHTLPYVDVATGSLGQGLAIAVGMALNWKLLDRIPCRAWVLLGDSEMAEGSIWEAVDKAGYYHLDNLIAILDMNRLGQRGPTSLGWNSAAYAARLQSFGWHTIELDGHDLTAIDAAYAEALAQQEKPICLIAKTLKGAGVSAVEDKEGWHGKAFDSNLARTAIAELGGERKLQFNTLKPEPRPSPTYMPPIAVLLPSYAIGTKEAPRKAYGDSLVALGKARAEVVAIDAEVSNSTYAEDFKNAFPDRFFEMFIAEQQAVSAAVGFSVVGKRPFVSTFAAFFTRAFDQIRMAAISNANIRLVGSHAGVSIGEDGPSQMALEDIAMMRAVFGSTILYPCDANQTAHLVKQMLELRGISFLRTTREKLPVIYSPEEAFPVGKSKVLHQSATDRVTLVAAGITVHESLKAYQTLQSEGIPVRVIDAYSVKPIDRETLSEAAQLTGKFVVVEDHYAEGGLGDAVLDAFADQPTNLPRVCKLAVRKMPGSGTPEELLNVAEINAEHIVQAVRSLI